MTIRIQWQQRRRIRRQQILAWAERFFLAAGGLTLAFCGLVYLEASLYQNSEDKVFETFPQANRELGRTIGSGFAPTFESAIAQPGQPLPAPIREGSPLSRIEIPRLGVSVVVVEGVRPRNLRLAVGHIPGTALPGEPGNIGIAGHRDTFFRKLGQIHEQDRITLTTLRGSFEYTVESTQIVDPANTGVLHSSREPILTLVTCYPFYYVGPAPKRFIVQAREEVVPKRSLLPK